MIQKYSKVKIKKNVHPDTFQVLKNEGMLSILNKRITGYIYKTSVNQDIFYAEFKMPSGKIKKLGFLTEELEEVNIFGKIKKNNNWGEPIIANPVKLVNKFKQDWINKIFKPKRRGHPLTDQFKRD
jgi:hypothetical protein